MNEDIINMAKEVGATRYTNRHYPDRPTHTFTVDQLAHFVALAQTKAAMDERNRICKAIKEEDDYCVTEGDYMLDSDNCIAVAKGEWVRPDFSVPHVCARGKS